MESVLVKLFTAFVAAEGIVTGSIAYVLFLKKKSKLESCRKTLGEIIDIKQRHGSDGEMIRHLIIKYKDSNGKDIIFESKFGHSYWKVKIGDKIEILINDKNPNDTEVMSFVAQWGLVLALGMVSISSFITAPIVYLIMKK